MNEPAAGTTGHFEIGTYGFILRYAGGIRFKATVKLFILPLGVIHITGEQGFEPRSATLKAAVLPLNHSPWSTYRGQFNRRQGHQQRSHLVLPHRSRRLP